MTKYAGADWLLKRLIRKCNYPISDFGVKVANVLGQVYKGIYHIEREVLSRKVNWNACLALPMTVFGELATYDDNYLSRLVFCCQSAGIGVDICGSFKRYTRLVFLPKRAPLRTLLDVADEKYLTCDPESPCGDFNSFAERFTRVKRIIQSFCGDGSYLGIYSVEWIDWISLQLLVNECHEYNIRCSLVGLSYYTLEAQFSQRKKVGHFWQHHPSLKEHRLLLAKDIDVDYDSVD